MLYDKTNYTADISYLNNIFITEYDISKCNINVLFTKGIIDKNTYNYLYNAERMVRQVYVGKLQKDKSVADALKSGIIEAKRMLFEANNLHDRDILSIKNDAVFVINRKLQTTQFGLIKFTPKGVYTSFYKLRGLEAYYYYNNINKNEYIEIKGMSDKNLVLHENYFLQFLKDVFYTIQTVGPEIALRLIKDFYMQYTSMQLPVEYYRMFDASSEYHYMFKTGIGTGFNINYIPENSKMAIDKSYNLSIIMQMQRYVVSMYFNKYK